MKSSSLLRTRILGTGSYLPDRVLSNEDLEKIVDTTHDWILERTGIRERRIASEKEATSDLAYIAAERALETAGMKASELDLILVATATPDMIFPSTACIVQDRLQARQAFAFDISAACSGFVYGLSVVDQFLRSGQYTTGIVIGAEVLSRFVDWQDRSTCILFGDGAGAAVLGAERGERGILSTRLHSDGGLWDLLSIPGGGSRHPASDRMLRDRLPYVKMRGNETFKVAVNTLVEVAEEILKHHHLRPEDIGLLIPHQANLRILQAVAKKMNLPMGKVMINLDRYGNTSAASVPIALDEAIREGRIRENDLVLLEAFGGGLTWGAALIRW
jgi:3-oxoacyl-[acyl-carrier-protein] synthase-3